ncbi:hypothetical protein FF125_17960 [Aureibaculum algae]|uniref:Uncharacterized protein n=1 Tax=Aureibaculum algae TaxID=2584122 RepID=A0A5B7TVA5_9FLAO|nr:hypothetical protein [Aureibaculum algae]QCX40240.1 hypothetical protein FF125_17960 [Aureibaculum algae]
MKSKKLYQRFVQLLLLLIIIVTLNSCGFCNVFSKHYYFTGNGGVRPGKTKFDLSKDIYVLKKEDFIKTNVIYQSCSKWNKEALRYEATDCSDATATISFIRFFNNGRVLINTISEDLSPLNQYNNLEGGTVGYYKIEENELIIEYFSVSIGGMTSDCGKYYIDKYKLSVEGIELQEIRRSDNGIFYGWRKVEHSVPYIKKGINGLKGDPNW